MTAGATMGWWRLRRLRAEEKKWQKERLCSRRPLRIGFASNQVEGETGSDGSSGAPFNP